MGRGLVPVGDARIRVKRGLALLGGLGGATAAKGVTVLIHHRVGGGTHDELDVPVRAFDAQMRMLAEHAARTGHPVLPLDDAADRLDRGDDAPATVLTFDDGFADLYTHAFPVLRTHRLPFTVYLASGCVGGPMRWAGSTATSAGAPGLTWDQLAEMRDSGLCTVANHTRGHARPEALTTDELDACTADIERRLGLTPRHFAYPWGIPVPRLDDALRARFRTAATGRPGRNRPGADPMRLRRVPVRRTDPPAFFRAKLTGALLPEHAYAGIVGAAKAVGARA